MLILVKTTQLHHLEMLCRNFDPLQIQIYSRRLGLLWTTDASDAKFISIAALFGKMVLILDELLAV